MVTLHNKITFFVFSRRFFAILRNFSLFCIKTNLFSPHGRGRRGLKYISTTFKVVKMAISLAKGKMAPFVSRCKSNGLVHSGDKGLQEKLFICQEFNQKFEARRNKRSVDEIRKICAAVPNRLKVIAEKECHHKE